MDDLRFVHWEDDGIWIGYLADYPDYWTQGESLDDLKVHLKELESDLRQHGGEISIRPASEPNRRAVTGHKVLRSKSDRRFCRVACLQARQGDRG